MTIGLTSLILLVFFVAAIVIGYVKKVNTGLVGLCFAIVAALIFGLKFKVILSGFPTTVVMALFSVTLFFGFFIQNGTVNWIAGRLIYTFRNYPKLFPFVFFFVAMFLGAFGGPNTIIFICAFAIPIGFQCGIKAWEVGAICLMGCHAGSYSPFSTHGITARSIIETMNEGAWAEYAFSANWKYFFTSVVVYLVIVAIFYVVFKNYKIQKMEGIQPPQPLTDIQKKSLFMIAALIVLMIGPFILTKFIDNSTFKRVTTFADITPLAIIGSFVNMLLGLGDEKEVLKNRIPWGTITMIFGMAMFVNLASQLGVLDYVGSLLTSLPAFLITPLFLITAGTLSLFSSSLSVVYPTLLPLAGSLVIANGMNPISVFAAVVIGSATTAMSPLSMGGGQILAATPEECCDNSVMFTKMFLMALVCMALLAVQAFLGLFGIFSL